MATYPETGLVVFRRSQYNSNTMSSQNLETFFFLNYCPRKKVESWVCSSKWGTISWSWERIVSFREGKATLLDRKLSYIVNLPNHKPFECMKMYLLQFYNNNIFIFNLNVLRINHSVLKKMAVFVDYNCLVVDLFTSPPKAVHTGAGSITQVFILWQFQFFNVSCFDERSLF